MLGVLKNIFKSSDSIESPLSAEQHAFWEENGYLVLPGFFNDERLSDVLSVIDEIWEDKSPENPHVIDILSGAETGKRCYIRDVDNSTRSEVYKLNDIFLTSEKVRQLILDKALCNIIHALYDGAPLVCNSLSFERGSQQASHFDTWYMPPPEKDKMVVSSILLEDMRKDAGPLEYYPGSHKIAPYVFSHGKISAIDEEMDECFKYVETQIAEHRLEKKQFIGKKGDVFLWHSQLLHGGAPIKDKSLTRKTIVTHYWRKKDFANPLAVGKEHDNGYYIKREHQKVA